MAHPFGKAPTWRRVFQVVVEFGGACELAGFECKDAPPIYKLSLKDKEVFFPIADDKECLAPSLVKNLTRQLKLPNDAFGEHYE